MDFVVVEKINRINSTAAIVYRTLKLTNLKNLLIQRKYNGTRVQTQYQEEEKNEFQCKYLPRKNSFCHQHFHLSFPNRTMHRNRLTIQLLLKW